MLTTFRVVLLIVLTLTTIATITDGEKEVRQLSIALALASMIALFLTFILL